MWNYKPCKMKYSYLYENESVIIYHGKGAIKLTSAGMYFWEFANGKRTVSELVDMIEEYLGLYDKQTIYKNTIKLMIDLHEKELIILNWDPLLKDRMSQDITDEIGGVVYE
ncbi:PqqD family protein [Lachnoclostridium phytofermentans]|uniref:PqqD family protein n=1 Tax=Lachnoclostridium phytofermentans (strain ATCC 700394 / DSM 18823 / ISDg) TaxID=357809 RepID=A9KIR1_LACP7|nr:PqqD family protein [Lachnoclostridium phytofermentans]ABX43924.1 hypothetical protein Cphy_3575 [Lachnoclostridium phytofermentans ISDg]